MTHEQVNNALNVLCGNAGYSCLNCALSKYKIVGGKPVFLCGWVDERCVSALESLIRECPAIFPADVKRGLFKNGKVV